MRGSSKDNLIYFMLAVDSGPSFSKSFKTVPDLTCIKEPDHMQETEIQSFKLDSSAL